MRGLCHLKICRLMKSWVARIGTRPRPIRNARPQEAGRRPGACVLSVRSAQTCARYESRAGGTDRERLHAATGPPEADKDIRLTLWPVPPLGARFRGRAERDGCGCAGARVPPDWRGPRSAAAGRVPRRVAVSVRARVAMSGRSSAVGAVGPDGVPRRPALSWRAPPAGRRGDGRRRAPAPRRRCPGAPSRLRAEARRRRSVRSGSGDRPSPPAHPRCRVR